MINRSQLKFHETFQPETNYISSILELAVDHYQGTKFQISDDTGIPTGKQKGKVEPSIKYASFMGLIRFSCDKGVYVLEPTTLGSEIFMQDKYLHEDLTKWLCHYNLSLQERGAAQWSYIVHNAHCGFVQSVSSEHLLQKANQDFELNVSFEEMFGVVKRSYMDGIFSSLEYLEWTDEVTYTEHFEAPELVYVYGYSLLKSWEMLFPEKNEITLNDVIDTIGLGKVFGLPQDEAISVLDGLADEGIVKVNRQLFPATIVRVSTAEDIIGNLYSRLL